MFKKILMCAILASPFAAAPALADGYHSYDRREHHYASRGEAWSRPVVLKGYYGAERHWPHAHGRGYGFHSYAAAAAWRSYHSGYRTGEAAYAEDTQVRSADADIGYVRPVLAYSHATAYVPVTAYARVPVRVYYVTQHEPYYNVPPYAVREPCFCD